MVWGGRRYNHARTRPGNSFPGVHTLALPTYFAQKHNGGDPIEISNPCAWPQVCYFYDGLDEERRHRGSSRFRWPSLSTSAGLLGPPAFPLSCSGFGVFGRPRRRVLCRASSTRAALVVSLDAAFACLVCLRYVSMQVYTFERGKRRSG